MKNRSLFINILIGITVLSIPVLTSPDFGTETSLFSLQPFQQSFLSYVLLLVFYYLNYYLFIPKLYSKRKYWAYGLVLALSFVVVSEVPSTLFFRYLDRTPFLRAPYHQPPNMMGENGFKPPMNRPNNAPFIDVFQFRRTYIFQFIMVVVLSLLYKLDSQLKEIRSKKLKAEVSYLKAQINPHFLFNTLNSIYALSLTKSEKAPYAILKLSDMMRYVVSESDTEFVSLEKELQYIEDYIALQKLRIGGQVNLSFTVEGDIYGKRIAPIILINYVENAFKYGVNPDKPSKINIFVTVSDSGIQLTTENDIVVDKENYLFSMEEGTKNTKQRLDVLYKNKYTLEITTTEHHYKMNLYLAFS